MTLDNLNGEKEFEGRAGRMPRLVEFVARVLLAVVFMYAGVSKMLHPAEFAGSIATFKLLPQAWSNLLALTLPPFEIAAGLLILSRRWRSLAAFSLLCLNLIFLVALTSALVRGLPVDCGCFGSSGPSSPAKIVFAMVRDVVLVVLCAFVYGWRGVWGRIVTS